MLDNLIKLIQENAGDAIINNPAIPNEKNNEAVELAGNGIVSQLQNLAGNGGLQNVIQMFNGGDGKQEQVAAISNNVAGDLMKKLGLDSSQAGSIVQSLIPKVMDQFISKTNDANDNSFDLQDIIGSLNGGNSSSGGLMDKLKGLF